MIYLIENFRIALFLISWFAAVSSIVFTSADHFLIYVGVSSFFLFLLITLVYVNRQSLIIISFLLFIYIITVDLRPTFEDIIEAGKYILIFAGLIPTMGLVRSTAQKLNNVKQCQALLSKLSKDSFASGFQITAHFFGAVINTGVFAMLAAAMPPKSSAKYRQKVAEASLRGMSSSATWSPFFVAFVVGQVYLDSRSAWLGLAIGLFMGSIFSLLSVVLLNKKLTYEKFKLSLACLKPVFSTLTLIIVLVVSAAMIFGLTALSAVVVVMPILVGSYFLTKPKHFKPIMIDTVQYLKKSTDDVVIISFAMIVGYLVTNSPETLTKFQKLNLFAIPEWLILIFIPVTMATVSLIGVHPVISSTILLSTFISLNFDISAPLLMQAHLLGWCTGTMSSIASLSVITCSKLFQIPSSKLCYGINGYTTISFAVVGGVILTLLNQLINL